MSAPTQTTDEVWCNLETPKLQNSTNK